MGYNYQGFPKLASQLQKQLMQLDGRAGVKVARGFIGQNYFGLVNQGAGHSHTLLFAA
jgi:hypothetical protein